MGIIKKIYLLILLWFCFSCDKPNKYFYGNWSWVSTTDEKYYEVLIDDNVFIGYRHAFLYPREFKLTRDSLFIDKINENNFDLSYKIKILNDNKILLSSENNLIELSRINKNSFTIDSIKNEKDKQRFELEFSTREDIWIKKHDD